MAARLKDHYKVLYTGKNGTCAHEFIIDLRPMKVLLSPGRPGRSLTQSLSYTQDALMKGSLIMTFQSDSSGLFGHARLCS